MRLICRQSDNLEDWYIIEKAEHQHRIWWEQTSPNSSSLRDSARISDACVEGTAEEMFAIAKAIQGRTGVSFKRCAVFFSDAGVHFFSPRNSQVDGVVTIEDADQLAAQILSTIDQGKIDATDTDADTAA